MAVETNSLSLNFSISLSAFMRQSSGPVVVLVGMSMGCVNALRYAIDHPERLAGIVAVDAGPWVFW